ncbi:gamma-secretase-activating protein-like isoform X2 [Ptychodera flava]|uniref:gamma-secretase-activating protein-like isoform X2 n=1 Tax=Ptychodera flava TaxID=63121 RepID=UPI003969DF7C
MMLDFNCCFDAECDINDFVRTRKCQQAQSEPRATSAGEKDSESDNVTIIGQERNGEILFTWDDQPPSEKRKANGEVTYIGLYDQSTKKNSVLFIHDSNVHIVGCSINQERTLIAFTTLGNVGSSKETKPTLSGVYRSFLAEVQPQNRVFSLNIERRNLLKCQFLYSKLKGFSETPSKDTHMLFFLHKESIGQYRISLGRMGDKAVVMIGQPRTKQIAKKFLWAQWDVYTQRLFFLHRRKRRNSRGDNGDDVQLTCFEFKDATYEAVLNLSLTLPMPKELSWHSHQVNFLGQHITDENFNMEIITNIGGSLCICYQHPLFYPKSKNKEPLQVLKDDPEEEEEWEELAETETLDLYYSVLMLHHGYTLRCCIPKVPRHFATKMKLQFISLNDYLLVFVPGYVAHLLNVSSELEPCHHIVLPVSDVPHPTKTKGGLAASVEGSQQLVGFLHEKTSCDSILDCTSGKAYRVSLSKEGIVNMFRNSRQPATKLALLHLAIVHVREMDLIKKLMILICSDVMSFDTSELLSEVLVASTYSGMRKQLDKEVLKFLPFTGADTFRGQLEKDNSGQQMARFTYVPKRKLIEGIISKQPVRQIPGHSEGAVDKRDRRHTEAEFWDSIRTHLKLIATNQHRRFNTTSVKHELEVQQHKSMESSEIGNSKVASLPRRNYSTPAINKRAQLQDFSITVPFLEKQDQLEISQETRAGLLVDKLATHLSKNLKRETKVKSYNIATEFVACQLRQSKLLLQMMWTALGYEADAHCVQRLSTLKREATEEDHAFFHILERYYYVAEELCYPVPSGFVSLITILGYNCLDNQTFLHYVDAGIFRLNDDFLRAFIQELKKEDNDNESARMKFQIINRLDPQTSMIEALEQWNHPTASRYLSQQYVSEVLLENEDDPLQDDGWEKVKVGALSEHSYSESIQNSMSVVSDDGASSFEILSVATFPPLTTLIRYIESKETNDTTQLAAKMTKPIDSKYVEDNALHYTVEQCGENLSHVTF